MFVALKSVLYIGNVTLGERETYSAGVVAGTGTVPAAPLIRVLSWLRIRVGAIYIVHTDLVGSILE